MRKIIFFGTILAFCILLSTVTGCSNSQNLDSFAQCLTEKGVKMYGIPATRLAEDMGRKIVMNIITVGFFSAITGVTSFEATKKAVESSVPPGTEEMNLRAFETGYNYGAKLLEEEKGKRPKAKEKSDKVTK